MQDVGSSNLPGCTILPRSVTVTQMVLVHLFQVRILLPQLNAHIAQLEEHLFCTQEVAGSVPAMGSMSKRYSEDLSMSYLNLIGYWTGHP